MDQGPSERWIADRVADVELSGVRKMFELSRSLKDPVNLSIGQPHFPVPESIKAAAKAAIDADHNGYTVTQGIPELRAKIKAWLDQRYGPGDREVLITSGTSGGLLLTLLATINPGDEVLTTDPYWVGYPHFATVAGGKLVTVDTYPDFALDPDKFAAAITPRTKAILLNTPANPTGVVPPRDTLRAIAELARERRLLLISDEIYRAFCYGAPFCSPAEFNRDAVVLDGFGKSYGITGWRLGFAHGPRALIEAMAKLQQFTYVCAPSIVQHAGIAAWDFDPSPFVADYRRKRDRVIAGLRGRYEVVTPGGAFYVFPKAPWGTATEFVTKAVEHSLLIIPGNTFSRRDTHFRVSYAADDAVLDRGIDILNRLARG
jgi:aspartate aminotransferase/aminotransferase